MRFDGSFVELVSGSLFDGDRIAWARAEAVSDPVAEIVREQFRFSLDDLDGPFGAAGHAEATPVAFVFVDLHDRSGGSVRGGCGILLGHVGFLIRG